MNPSTAGSPWSRQAVVAIWIMLLATSTTGLAQSKGAGPEHVAGENASADLDSPGPEHQRLQALVGKWKLAIKVRNQPDQEGMTLTGQCENKMILGGRFLVSETHSGNGAWAIETITIIGFDRRNKRYTMVVFDTTGTSYGTSAGSYDQSLNAIVTSREDQDPGLNSTRKHQFVISFLGPSTYTQRITVDSQLIEMTYTRVE